MKKLMIIAGFIALTIFYSCNNTGKGDLSQEDPGYEVFSKDKKTEKLYQQVKGIKIDTLPEPEKQKAIETWITILKNDPDFINGEEVLQKYINKIAEHDEKNMSGGKKHLKKADKPKVIKNPKNKAQSQSAHVENYLVIVLKYPEFKEMDSKTRRFIFKEVESVLL